MEGSVGQSMEGVQGVVQGLEVNVFNSPPKTSLVIQFRFDPMYNATPPAAERMYKPFHGIFHHLESGHSSWNAHSNYTETAVKLFSQVYTAQNFQVNI